ncbi:hypothetical protein SUGI_0575940 [Cryptomeria japonica]|nr:hypothetical protein SUGI_0575940 [Cryptomeria japonica]
MDVSGFLETGHAADKLYIDFNKFNESSANLLDFLGDAIVSGNEIGLTNISRLNGYNPSCCALFFVGFTLEGTELQSRWMSR